VRVRAGIIFTVIVVSVVAVVGALLVGNVRMFRCGKMRQVVCRMLDEACPLYDHVP
jgi:hypothetical protein